MQVQSQCETSRGSSSGDRDEGFDPDFIIGVPVGFVNVVYAKEQIIKSDIPYIVNRGRKGGSNIAACLVNAALYNVENRQL